jgi:hypothetical protein
MPLMIGQNNSQIFLYISKVWAFLPSYEQNHLLRIQTDWIYGGDQCCGAENISFGSDFRLRLQIVL